MFKIGEFSRLTQVSVRMLRYYDENGLLKPAKVDPVTGYRLYDAGQIQVLNKIVFMRDVGFSVAEMASLLYQADSGIVAGAMARKKAEIRQAIRLETERIEKIDMWLRSPPADAYAVTIKSIPSYQVLSYRKIIPDYYAEGAMWKEMARFARDNNSKVQEDTFSIYHDPDYREADVDVELCVLVSEMGMDQGGFVYRHTEPVESMACTMVHGPFEKIAGAFLSFAAWIEKHSQYTMGLTSRQIVHRGPWNEEEKENYLTEIQIPLDSHTV